MNEKLTPMMQQWMHCKKKAKDSLLLFRLGDFYEAFYEDAEIISKKIGLTLTKRQNIPMCGVPYHSAESYIDKLLKLGYKIAIAEQLEEANSTKKIVKRDIVKILSPATVVTSSLLEEKSNNFFVSLSQIGSLYAIAALDLTTSDFFTYELNSLADLKDELYKLRPKEILISQKFKKNNDQFLNELSYFFTFLLTIKEDWQFDHKVSYDSLIDHFSVHSLDGFGLKNKIAAINASGALINYLKNELHHDIKHIEKISLSTLSKYMSIDHTCMRNLEIFDSLSNNSNNKNTLIEIIDFTKTSMGGRLLKKWLFHPLLDIVKIKLRQKAIEELEENQKYYEIILNHLSKIKDLERLMMKISTNQASPKDLIALKSSIENIPYIKKILKNHFSSTFYKKEEEKLTDLLSLYSIIENNINDDPPLKISDGNVIKDGINNELDELRDIKRNSNKWLKEYQEKLKNSFDIKHLRVGYTKIFGFYIEVSKGQASKMPETFQKRQTLVNAERFISEELKAYEHKMLTAEDQINRIENSLYKEIIEKVSSFYNEIHINSKAIAQIDCIFSLYKASTNYNWTKPKIDDSDILNIQDGRHPIIENSSFLNSFIPNDTYLDQDENRLYLITGPNMAGKSTYIRQVALIVILAQIGSYVPASKAHIGIIDKVFSRIGASDDLTRGQSTFMVEMSETANILNNATSRSLIILDEIGRGTSTYDGISIAWAVAEYILTTPNKRAKTLFATHYWELTKMQETIKGAVNYNVEVEENEKGIVFLRKIIKGGTDKSYGIHVAKLAGLPYGAIEKAEKMLLQLESKSSNKFVRKKIKETNSYPLFEMNKSNELIEDLKKIDIENLTPIEALKKIFDIKEKASKY